ncbi:hypothetical protein [Fluoribacter gormanii]|uniref:Gamma-glutamyl-gamma-aminobutyrate hydrolase n=8 Tax=Fluoribacter gormanii TaxID=464 RepID=A0A377GGE2_9GAMM|nr:hypothetical protein [Fluoribacter gormanii]STO23831.1 gamma-glutamyl-gamma-aminobutyrate hydrolase [Fluoribacter gormanii]
MPDPYLGYYKTLLKSATENDLVQLQAIIDARDTSVFPPSNEFNNIRQQLEALATIKNVPEFDRDYALYTMFRAGRAYGDRTRINDGEAIALRGLANKRYKFLQIKAAIEDHDDQGLVDAVSVADINQPGFAVALGNNFGVQINANGELLDRDRQALKELATQRSKFLQIKAAIEDHDDQGLVDAVSVADINQPGFAVALGNNFGVQINANGELLARDRQALNELATQRSKFLQIKAAIEDHDDQGLVDAVSVADINQPGFAVALGNNFGVQINANGELLDRDRQALNELATQRSKFLQIKAAIEDHDDQGLVDAVSVADINQPGFAVALGNNFGVQINANGELLDRDRQALNELATQRSKFLQIKAAIEDHDDQGLVDAVSVADINQPGFAVALGNNFGVQINANGELLDRDRQALKELATQRSKFLQIKAAIEDHDDQGLVDAVSVADINQPGFAVALGNNFGVQINANGELLDRDRQALNELATQRSKFLQIKAAIEDHDDQGLVDAVSVADINQPGFAVALGNNFGVQINANGELLARDRQALKELATQRSKFLQIKAAIEDHDDQGLVDAVSVADINQPGFAVALGNNFGVQINANGELLARDRQALNELATQRSKFLQIKAAIEDHDDQGLVDAVSVADINQPGFAVALGNNFGVQINANGELLARDRQALKELATQRNNFLKIKAAIMASEDQTLVRGVGTADDTQPAFAVALGNHFGVDIRSIDDLLPADRASLRKVARQQINYLVVKSKIDAITPSNSNSALLQLLKAIKDAPNNPDDLRLVLSNKTSLGINEALTINHLSDEHLRKLQTLTTQKYNALIIRDKISKITDPSVLEHFIHNIGPGTENDVRRELRNPAFGGLTLPNSDALSDTDANSIKLLIQSKYDTVRGNKIAANAYVQNAPDPRLRHFSDQLVKKDAPRPNIPLSVAAPDAINLSAQNDLDTRYKGAKLHEGDQIYSIANFPKKVRTGVDVGAQGVLVQDHVGKVTDMTTAQEKAKLTSEEKVQMALKQAKMFLTNLKGTGEETIYLAGDDPEQAKRVCAAVLLLKGSLNVKIESQVPGFDVPKAKWNERQATVDKEFIKTHLPDSAIPKSSLEGIQKETHKFIETTKARREQMSSLRQKDVVGDEFTHSGAKKPSV